MKVPRRPKLKYKKKLTQVLIKKQQGKVENHKKHKFNKNKTNFCKFHMIRGIIRFRIMNISFQN